MSKSVQNFTLTPFDLQADFAGISVSGTIQLKQQVLHVEFNLSGRLEPISIPKEKRMPDRQSQLWEHTCLELFLGPTELAHYWEINVSPSGNWNSYHFDAYRQGMKLEPLLRVTNFKRTEEAKNLSVQFDLDVSPLVVSRKFEKRELECAITCVLESKNHISSFWALEHSGNRPDFHSRATFQIKFPASEWL
jgi:hypothetical protein